MNKILVGIVAILVLVGMAIVAVAFLGSDMIPPDPVDDDDPPEDDDGIYEFSTVGYAGDGDPVCRACGSNKMWIGFRIPDDSIVTRVQGEIKMDLLENPACPVWFHMWDVCSQDWPGEAYVIDSSYIHDGWVAVDFTIPSTHNFKTHWIGFSGCYDSEYGADTPYNIVTEFSGKIYYTTSTTDCNPLQMIQSVNPFRNLAPSAPPSCSTC